MFHRRLAFLTLALISTMLPLNGIIAPAVAAEPSLRSGPASISYCGFSGRPADSVMQMGGGGDTIVVSNAYDMYYFVSDNESPVTLTDHDTLLFQNTEPNDLRLERIEDNLVICHDLRRMELVIHNHYCRASGPTATASRNFEVEAIVFTDTGVIWLSDVLYPLWRQAPDTFPRPNEFQTGRDARAWKIYPFAQKLPSVKRMAKIC